MIVVAGTAPLNYLILSARIGWGANLAEQEQDVLPNNATTPDVGKRARGGMMTMGVPA